MQSVKPKCKIQNEMTDFVVKFDDTRTLCERIESRKLSPFGYAQGRHRTLNIECRSVAAGRGAVDF